MKGAQIDVVDICTPTGSHADLAVQAIKAGRHVLLEKPMARTLEGCDRIIEAAEKSDKAVMVAHVLRWFPEFASAKAAIDAGKVGKAAVVRTSRGGGAPAGRTWYRDFEQSGGVVLDLILHDFDWLLWCFGPAERVYAKGLAGMKNVSDGQDYALVTIRFKCGTIAHVEGTWMRPSGFETKFEVAGDGGLIEFSSRNAVPLRVSVKGEEAARAAVEVPESPLAESPYLREIRHFLECVKTGAKPAVSLQEARDAVQVALSAIESMKTGQPVELA